MAKWVYMFTEGNADMAGMACPRATAAYSQPWTG